MPLGASMNPLFAPEDARRGERPGYPVHGGARLRRRRGLGKRTASSLEHAVNLDIAAP